MKFLVHGAKRDTGDEVHMVVDAASSHGAERFAQEMGVLVATVEPRSRFRSLWRRRWVRVSMAVVVVGLLAVVLDQVNPSTVDELVEAMSGVVEQVQEDRDVALSRRGEIGKFVALTEPLELFVFKPNIMRSRVSHHFEATAKNHSQATAVALVARVELLDSRGRICAWELLLFEVDISRPMNAGYLASTVAVFRDVPDAWLRPYRGATPPVHSYGTGNMVIQTDTPRVVCSTASARVAWVYMLLEDGTQYGSLLALAGPASQVSLAEEPMTPEELNRKLLRGTGIFDDDGER